MAMISLSAMLQANPPSAEKLFQAGKYSEAAQEYGQLSQKEPNELRHAYNQGLALFKNQQFEEAVQGFARAAQSSDTQLAADAFFNLGNALVAKGQLQEAAGSYQEVLKRFPQDKAAQENLQWVQKQIQQQKNEKNDQSGKDNSKDDKKSSQDKQEEQDKPAESSQQDKEKKEEENKQAKEHPQDKSNEGKVSQDKSTKVNEGQQPENQQEAQSSANEQQQSEASAAHQQKSGEAPKSVSEQEALRLLRGLEEQEQKYGVPQRFQRPAQQSKQDW
jgi:Ca-activated chloride channel homolog